MNSKTLKQIKAYHKGELKDASKHIQKLAKKYSLEDIDSMLALEEMATSASTGSFERPFGMNPIVRKIHRNESAKHPYDAKISKYKNSQKEKAQTVKTTPRKKNKIEDEDYLDAINANGLEDIYFDVELDDETANRFDKLYMSSITKDTQEANKNTNSNAEMKKSAQRRKKKREEQNIDFVYQGGIFVTDTQPTSKLKGLFGENTVYMKSPIPVGTLPVEDHINLFVDAKRIDRVVVSDEKYNVVLESQGNFFQTTSVEDKSFVDKFDSLFKRVIK